MNKDLTLKYFNLCLQRREKSINCYTINKIIDLDKVFWEKPASVNQ